MLRLYGAAKIPHRNRVTLARMLGRNPNSLHLHELHVGGGFGVRGQLYPEDVLVLVAAMRLGRPVKWIEDRREHLMATNHSRQQRHNARLALDAEGRILGIDDEFFHDQGAYIRTHGINVAIMTLWAVPGPYRVPNYRGIAHFRLTNKTPAATYRAPGAYEGTFVRERLLDVAAQKLGMDRLPTSPTQSDRPGRNAVSAQVRPGESETQILDSGDYPGLLQKALGERRDRESSSNKSHTVVRPARRSDWATAYSSTKAGGDRRTARAPASIRTARSNWLPAGHPWVRASKP